MSTAPLDDVLTTHLHRCGGRCVVRLRGELDTVSGPRVAAALDEVLACPCAGAAVLVDLRAVSFCDLDGLRTLRAARARAAQRGVDLTCEGCSPLLLRVAAIVGYRELLAAQE
ncbi:STAS domain-containing protein [Kineococcus endophyticus]|uniref:STAS domain-containing protein n=1 Tax=Kineococcus endophyticus TaxID=1181883 RepID=A0ABV3P947_9ACTN